MQVNLIESDSKISLWPLGATRHIADLRIGILTIREKWERMLASQAGSSDQAVNVPASYIPTLENYQELLSASRSGNKPEAIEVLKYPWQLFKWNDRAIRDDFRLLTAGRQSGIADPSNTLINPSAIFIEEGAEVRNSILNASSGPVYIGKDALVMEGCLIRGPFAMCRGSVLKMGTKIYGATTLGPYSVGGGEIKNSILSAYSNKAHDGYLGDSVIGEWCNLGAGTTTSNVNNNAGEVYYQAGGDRIPAGIKGGLIMGDYSRSAINTSFNTGTMVGVCCNVFYNGFPPKVIPDFTWGDNSYIFEKALEDISNWKKFKNQSLSESETETLKLIYQSKNAHA